MHRLMRIEQTTDQDHNTDRAADYDQKRHIIQILQRHIIIDDRIERTFLIRQNAFHKRIHRSFAHCFNA